MLQWNAPDYPELPQRLVKQPSPEYLPPTVSQSASNSASQHPEAESESGFRKQLRSCVPAFAALLLLQTTACATTPSGISNKLTDRTPAPEAAPSISIGSLSTPVFSIDSLPASESASQEEALFELARSRVEKQTNTDLSHVKLDIVTDYEIDQEVALETQRLVDSQFTSPAFQAHFLNQVMQSQTGSYAALYSHDQSAIMVSRSLLNNLIESIPADNADNSVRDTAMLALFTHELVHAADDVRFNIQKRRTLSFRASFAQSATFEGHAQWLTRKICQQHACLTGLKAIDEFMFGREEEREQSLPAVQAIRRNVLEYSYVEGENFIAALAERPSGDALIEQLLNSPPEDPIQILAPLSYPDHARESRNQVLIKAVREADHPWARGSWNAVESSPLKGVNLRQNPTRRQAAVDGFTRLMSAIVAMQLYDESDVEQAPKELTLIHAKNPATAQLFAQSLHDNTRGPEALATSRPISELWSSESRHEAPSGTLFQTWQMDPPTFEPLNEINDSPNWQTVIAVVGKHVVQVAGHVSSDKVLSQYAIAVLNQLIDPDSIDRDTIITSAISSEITSAFSTNSR